MQIIRISDVAKQTGLSPASIYKLVRLGAFPKPIKITSRATGWSSELVDAWINSKLSAEKSGEAGGAL